MTFIEAIAAAMAGSKVSRDSWSGMGGYIAFASTTKTVTGIGGAVLGTFTEASVVLSRVARTGAVTVYTINTDDANALDWSVLP